MKAEELMIGDWVNYNDKPKIITELSEIYNPLYDYLKPIPLTPQLLRRLGFDKRHNYWQLDEGWIITVLELNSVKPQVNVLITNYNNIDKTDYDSGWQDVIYLHELQHAMRLCRIDKKFEL